jgi:hypothetical protein
VRNKCTRTWLIFPSELKWLAGFDEKQIDDPVLFKVHNEQWRIRIRNLYRWARVENDPRLTEHKSARVYLPVNASRVMTDDYMVGSGAGSGIGPRPLQHSSLCSPRPRPRPPSFVVQHMLQSEQQQWQGEGGEEEDHCHEEVRQNAHMSSSSGGNSGRSSSSNNSSNNSSSGGRDSSGSDGSSSGGFAGFAFGSTCTNKSNARSDDALSTAASPADLSTAASPGSFTPRRSARIQRGMRS